MDVVALGEDFSGEGALFLRVEEGKVRDEGVDVAEDGVREGGGCRGRGVCLRGGGDAGEVGFDEGDSGLEGADGIDAGVEVGDD